MKDAGHLGSFSFSSGGTKHRDKVDSHGTGMFAAPAKGADPGKSRIDQFLVHPQQNHANGFSHIQSVHAGDRASTRTRSACETQVGVLGSQFALFALCQ
jgi:hypothetical protein